MTLPLSHGAALLLSCLFVGAVVAAGEALRRAGWLSPLGVRNLLHTGVGLWIVPTVFFFADWRVAVIPPLGFVLVNWVIHRFRLVASLGGDPANLGTVFFPLSFGVLLALFFRPGEAGDASFAAVAGLLVLALGDSAAAVVGRRYGTRRYTIFGHSRTMEGSLALFLTAGAVVAVVLQTMAGFGWHPAIAFGLVVGTVAAGIEAVCPFGSDNLFVPLGSATLVWALVRVSESALGLG